MNFDVMREIQRQGKFQLCNIELFKELAIMKLKEPEEGWGTFEWEEWPAGIAAPDQNLCSNWIVKQANTIFRRFLKRMKRMKEDEPALQGNENEKEKENNAIEKVSEMNMEEEDIGIQKASPKKAGSPKKPVALTKLNTRIKREGDVTNDKFDELPSDKAYVRSGSYK